MNLVKIGPCPVCGVNIWKYRRRIFDVKDNSIIISFKRVPYEQNEKGRHFWVLLSDGSRMMIAICKDCFHGLTLAMVKDIINDIIYTKLERIKKYKGEKRKKYILFDRIRTLEMVTWAGEEKEIVGYINEKISRDRRS